jgi:hypothetical protein
MARVVRQIRIHLQNIFVVSLSNVAQGVGIRLPQPFLPRAVKDENPLRIAARELVRQLTSSIGRIVVDYQQVGFRRIFANLLNQLRQISALIVGRYENDRPHG